MAGRASRRSLDVHHLDAFETVTSPASPKCRYPRAEYAIKSPTAVTLRGAPNGTYRGLRIRRPAPCGTRQST